jgi:hypothetical protein
MSTRGTLTRGERFYLLTGHVTWGAVDATAPAFCRPSEEDSWTVDEAAARRSWATHRDELSQAAALAGAVPWAVKAFDEGGGLLSPTGLQRHEAAV